VAGQANCDVSHRDRVHRSFHPPLQNVLGFVPPEPARTVLQLVGAWTAEHSQNARCPVILRIP
jgi:hypothetical protein